MTNCFYHQTEKGETKDKIKALKKLIYMILNGEKFPPNMLMTVIRYALPSQDHQIKKLLLIFWEIVTKRGPDGKLLHEMILVCDSYRRDLQHPNEYIRGSTLRFLCKLKEPELLEPLMPAIRACLEHRHSYVRRNAVLAIFKIYINFEFLIPDAPELILDFLGHEADASCKRNAFLMLIHLDQTKALDYLNSCLDQISGFNDILQLVIVELIYKVCIANPSERSRFIRAIYNLLNTATSASVRYEAAATLITLSQAPTALRAAASCFIDICIKESDNNVKLIVLDRLIALKESAQGAERILQESLMDILRILSVATDLEVKQKILNLALDLVSSRNVEEMVQLLKKEILKTQNESQGSTDETNKYRQLLVGTIHSISLKYPDVLMSSNLLSTLFELLTNPDDEASALLVIIFTREYIMKFGQHKNLIISKILEVFSGVRNIKVHRGLIWILGEFCDENQVQILEAMAVIRSCIGDIPIVESELKKLEDGLENEESSTAATTKTGGTQSNEKSNKLVTADGSYATQSALSIVTKIEKNNIPPLRSYFLSGEFFIGTALANCLVRLASRYTQVVGRGKATNRFIAESMLILTSILHLGRSKLISQTINDDDYERIALSLLILTNIGSENGLNQDTQLLLKNIFLSEMRSSLDNMLTITKAEKEEAKSESKTKKKCVESDDHLSFTQLMSKGAETMENQFDVSLSQAISGAVGPTATSSFGQKGSNVSDLLSASKLSKVTQLTGFSDPVYAECYVNVNQYDICLDVLIVNQSNDTLQNCTLELATLGDLKLVEKPQPIVLAAHDFANIKASVKVTSTENGIIFGNIGK